MTKIGTIGSGWASRVQTPLFREAGFEVLNVKGHDWRTLLDSDVDVVTITTPPSEHLEMASAFLARGKHVISEKPTALNVMEAQELVVAAEQRPELIALIDHELRFLPAWIAARERVRELGGVRYVEVRYSSPARGDRSREWNWWSDADRGGGILGAVGSHFADAIRYLVGEIEEVQAMLLTMIDERSGKKVTADDFAEVNLKLAGGAHAVMTLNAVASGPDEQAMITIHCEREAMRLIGSELLVAKRGEPYALVAGEEMPKLPGNSMGGAFGSGTMELARALKRALDEGDRGALAPAATFHDGLAQQRVLDAARRSSKNGGKWESIG
jgi:predicted dehydrogenase